VSAATTSAGAVVSAATTSAGAVVSAAGVSSVAGAVSLQEVIAKVATVNKSANFFIFVKFICF
jgi:hypothetical protein